ncbi:Glycylpeptide N-tetradecanoyltransferase 1 [Micractinium conductrix]|uniref:Glycylpeptide N-tetradecanoyltransferase n=1 Tax=Micractinium conductrix TaxID=554055 RepID=A0A2P6V9I1_9CHLO|nr:Glycylpeptide N-tetradecanoyltransferase 1 [Micractinium conductrix]|eukprot:PSC70746.1 Glycylpeptide N-tetradecanoyltransferase 1 [Micractinium conductrix]
MSCPPEPVEQDGLAERLRAALGALTMEDDSQPKQNYAFWGTQPVAQFGEQPASAVEDGPIDTPKTVEEVRKEPYGLPQNFEWVTCNIDNDAELKEIYELLSAHYVEDDDNMFRFAYSKEFLRWALQPPGFKAVWHCGVRVSSTGRLVAFISGIPATIRVNGNTLSTVEINFLCVHKKLRHKRLAPVLIKEITRRVNQHDIWQAVYTAGLLLPKPVAECQYWHRSLNPKKLIGVGFSRLAPRMTMARTLKLYKLPDVPQTPGLRQMEAKDVPQVTQLLNSYLAGYSIAPHMSEEEVAHWLAFQTDVIYSYVVEGPGGKLTDLLSFYTLPSSVIGNEQYDSLKAAYMFYTVPGATPLPQLMNDALTLAHSTGHDVFNALDIFENGKILKDLKFGIGDGKLRYYLFNWRVAQDITPNKVGLVML